MESKLQEKAPVPELPELPFGSDRRADMMRSALAVAIASLTARPAAAIAQVPAAAPPLDPSLAVEGGLAVSVTRC